MAKTVSFTSTAPTDYGLEAASIERQRKLAEALEAQSLQQPQGQTVSGWYVKPAWTQQLATALSGVASQYQQNKLDERSRALGQRMTTDRAETLARALSAGKGTEAAPGGLSEDGSEINPGIPAKPGNREAMGQILAGSKFPDLQAMGMQRIMQDADMAALRSVIPGGAGTTGAGTGANGVLPPLELLANPYGGKVWDALKDQNKPIALREGDLVVPDGKGGFRSAYSQPKLPVGQQPVRDTSGAVIGARNIPGMAEGQAQSAGAVTDAQESARATHDVVPVPDGKGGTVMMPRSALLQSMNPQSQAGPQPIVPNLDGPKPVVLPPGQDRTNARGLQGTVPPMGTRVPLLDKEIQQAEAMLARTTDPAERAQFSFELEALKKERAGAGPAAPSNADARDRAIPRLGYTPPKDEQVGAETLAREKAQQEAQRPQAKLSLGELKAQLSVMDKEIDKLLSKDVSLGSITGPIMGRLPSVKESSTNAEALLESLKSQISLAVVQAARDASKTGGAFGNMTEKEWPILQSKIGALQTKQGTAQFQAQLKDIKAYIKGMGERAEAAFNETYQPTPQRRAGDDPLGLRR